MPLISSSGVRPDWPSRQARPRRTDVRSTWPPTATDRRLSVVNISTGRGGEYLVALASGPRPALAVLTAARGEPVRVVRPPAAADRLRTREPLARISRVVGRGLERGLGVARRVDHGRDVPAGGQDERDRAAEELGSAIARLPGADVIGDSGNHVRLGVHLPEVHRRAEHPGGT